MTMDDPRKPDNEQRIREGVEDADATGMIAGEELITQAETMLPLLPHEELHAALPDEHPAHTTIDRLHDEVRKSKPDRAAIEAHVHQLRGLPELEATVANWWESPSTQRVIWNLSQIGL